MRSEELLEGGPAAAAALGDCPSDSDTVGVCSKGREETCGRTGPSSPDSPALA